MAVFCLVAEPGDVAEASSCSLQRFWLRAPLPGLCQRCLQQQHPTGTAALTGMGSAPAQVLLGPPPPPESPRPSCCCPGQPCTGPRGTALAPGWYQQPQSLPCAPWVEVGRGTRPLEAQGQTQTPSSQAVTPSHPLENPKPHALLARGAWVPCTLQGGSCGSHTRGRWGGQRHNRAALRRLRRVAKPFPAGRTSSSRHGPDGGAGAGSQQPPGGT